VDQSVLEQLLTNGLVKQNQVHCYSSSRSCICL